MQKCAWQISAESVMLIFCVTSLVHTDIPRKLTCKDYFLFSSYFCPLWCIFMNAWTRTFSVFRSYRPLAYLRWWLCTSWSLGSCLENQTADWEGKTSHSCTMIALPLVIFFFFSFQAAAIFNSAFGSFLVSNAVLITAWIILFLTMPLKCLHC